jgi:hypothetical protein
MGKVLLLLSLLALLFVGIGTALMPNNPMLWLASGAPVYQYARIALAVILLIQFTTNPPRHLWFRLLAGIVALVIGGWATQQTYDYHMQFLDTFAFLGETNQYTAYLD